MTFEEIPEEATAQPDPAEPAGDQDPATEKEYDDAKEETVSEGAASDPGDVRCGIPGFDHPGTELYGDTLLSTDPALRWEVRGRRNAAFTTDFDYRSDT